MRRHWIKIWIVIVVVLALVPPAGAAMFGNNQRSDLFIIDVTSGSKTFIGNMYMPMYGATTEIEYDSITGTLYAAGALKKSELHVIDPHNGSSLGFVNTPVGALNGLEFVGSTLYGTFIQTALGPSNLVIVDTSTGNLTTVGPTGFGPISGLAYDETSAVMYGITAGGSTANLVTINLITGAATVVGSTGYQKIGSIEFGDDGNLYGYIAEAGNPAFLQIDVSTGATTVIGTHPFYGITGLTLVPLLSAKADIFPAKCPNKLNPEQAEFIEIALLGEEAQEFDLNDVDPGTIWLRREGVNDRVAPVSWKTKDCTAPSYGDSCDCEELKKDGLKDMVLKFDAQAVIEALELDQNVGGTVPLKITASLTNGTLIEGEDCVFVGTEDTPPLVGVNPGCFSSHWPGGYYAQLYVEDFEGKVDAATVSGPGFDGKYPLTPDAYSSGVWWSVPNPEVSPPAPLTYTFHIESGGKKYNFDEVITGFVEEFATPIFPTDIAVGEFNFEWESIDLPGAEYQVQLYDVGWNRIWNSDKTTGTAVYYDWPPLTAGYYYYDVAAYDPDGNQSYAHAGFDFQEAPQIITIPTANMVVDGSPTDWTEIEPARTSPQILPPGSNYFCPGGVEHPCPLGSDLKAVRLAQHGNKLYYQFELWNDDVDQTGEIAYRLFFDTNQNGSIHDTDDIQCTTYFSGPGYSVYCDYMDEPSTPIDAEGVAVGNGRFLEGSVDAGMLRLEESFGLHVGIEPHVGNCEGGCDQLVPIENVIRAPDDCQHMAVILTYNECSSPPWWYFFNNYSTGADQVYITGDYIDGQYDLYSCESENGCDYWWSSNDPECIGEGNNNYGIEEDDPIFPLFVTYHIVRSGVEETYTETITSYDTAEPELNHSIWGHVTLEGQGNHSGVTVTLEENPSFNTLTDAAGYYYLEGFPEGDYTVSASKTGYITDTNGVWPFGSCSEHHGNADITLNPTGGGPPPPPTGLLATYDPINNLNWITWDEIPGATYDLYWGTGPGVTKNSEYAGNTPNEEFSHTGVVPGSTYYYRVAARNAAGESDLSEDEVSVYVPTTTTTNRSGNYRHKYQSWSGTAVGQWRYYAVDNTTGIRSNSVYYTISESAP